MYANGNFHRIITGFSIRRFVGNLDLGTFEKWKQIEKKNYIQRKVMVLPVELQLFLCKTARGTCFFITF